MLLRLCHLSFWGGSFLLHALVLGHLPCRCLEDTSDDCQGGGVATPSLGPKQCPEIRLLWKTKWIRDADYTPRKLTWNLKMKPWKRRFLFKIIIFRFHVSFRECNQTSNDSKSNPPPPPKKTWIWILLNLGWLTNSRFGSRSSSRSVELRCSMTKGGGLGGAGRTYR